MESGISSEEKETTIQEEEGDWSTAYSRTGIGDNCDPWLLYGEPFEEILDEKSHSDYRLLVESYHSLHVFLFQQPFQYHQIQYHTDVQMTKVPTNELVS